MTAMKGVRKPKKGRPAGVRIGRYVFPPQIVVAGLLSLLYAWFLIGGAYEGKAFLVQLVYFALFVVMIFVLLASQRLYTQIGHAFLVLAIPPLLWDAVAWLGYGPAAPELSWDVYVGIVSLLLGVGLTAALLYYEKGRLSDIYVRAGDLKQGIRIGTAVLVASAILAAALAYVSYGAGNAETSRLLPALGALVVFSVACAAAEELWFRGLLLSRLVPVTGDFAALLAQAVAFAAYEATFLYMLKPDALYATAVFAVALLAGIALAWTTIKSKSLLAAVLSHAGLYLVLALPVFAQFFY